MGNNNLRRAILLIALLCIQALAFAHAFDHPISAAHIDHACVTCAHGHFGSAPPGQSPTLTLALPPANLVTPPVNAGYIKAEPGRHAARAPPRPFV